MTKKRQPYINPVEVNATRPPQVELTEPVEPDKFDRHMRQARRSDITARRQTFKTQAEAGDRDKKYDGISPSIY